MCKFLCSPLLLRQPLVSPLQAKLQLNTGCGRVLHRLLSVPAARVSIACNVPQPSAREASFVNMPDEGYALRVQLLRQNVLGLQETEMALSGQQTFPGMATSISLLTKRAKLALQAWVTLQRNQL